MVFGGITNLLRKITGSELTTEERLERLLEETASSVSKEREKIVTSRERIALFGATVEDYNAIHLIPEKAKKKGLRDVPIIGTHIAAYAEQFAQTIIQHINQIDKNALGVQIRGQTTTFRDFAYPDENILWQVSGYRETRGGINLDISGRTNGRVIAETSVKLGTSPFPTQETDTEKVFSRRYSLNQERFDDFYNCVGGKSNGDAAIILPALFIPSTLLALLRDRTLEIDGINRSMDLNYMAHPVVGKPIQIDIFPTKREPRKLPDPNTGRETYLYKIEAACTQEDRQIATGEIVCLTPHNLDITKKSRDKSSYGLIRQP